MVESAPSFKDIAFFSSYTSSHNAPYIRLLDHLATNKHMNIYYGETYGSKLCDLSQKYPDLIIWLKNAYTTDMRTKMDKEQPIGKWSIVHSLIFMQAEAQIEEVEALWTKHNYKPKLIMGDQYLIQAQILAKKYDVPFINMISCMCLDYKEDIFHQYFPDPAIYEKDIDYFEKKYGVQFIIPEKDGKKILQPNFNQGVSDKNGGLILQPKQLGFKIDAPNNIFQSGPLLAKLDTSQYNFYEDIGKTEEEIKGKTIVYVSLGTVHNKRLDIFQAIADTLHKKDNIIAIFSIADVIAGDLKVTPNDILKPFWNQRQLLNHVHIFVTHCGFGSWQESVLAKVPMLGIPVKSDQPFNAKMLNKLKFGVGLEVEPPMEKIQEALDTVIANRETFKSNMAVVSDQVDCDDNLKGMIDYVMGKIQK